MSGMKMVFEKKLKRTGLAVALVIVFAATWVVLDRTEHRPGWLTVEAPSAAVVGQPLEIKVTLKRSVEANQIVCTLHRAGADRRLREHVASSGPARAAAGGGIYLFRFNIPDKNNLVFVSAVIYLSPTGSWQDRTRAAHTKLIPVKRADTGNAAPPLKRTSVYTSTSAAEDDTEERAARGPRRGSSPWAHPIIFVILISSAALCRAKAGRKRPDTSPEETRERTIWLAFAAVFVLGAFLELSGVVGHLAAWGRRLAEEGNLYDLRKPYQKAAMAAVAAAALGLFFLFIRAMKKPGSYRFVWGVGIGLAAYLSVSFVSVLSFHAIDVVGRMTWHGISPVDTVRGMGALVSLISAAAALSSRKRTLGR
jgi:hypothetical protein